MMKLFGVHVVDIAFWLIVALILALLVRGCYRLVRSGGKPNAIGRVVMLTWQDDEGYKRSFVEPLRLEFGRPPAGGPLQWYVVAVEVATNDGKGDLTMGDLDDVIYIPWTNIDNVLDDCVLRTA